MAQKKKGGKMVGKIVKTAVSGVLCIALAGGIVAANVLIPPNASSVQSILGLKSGGIDNSKAKTEGINMEYSIKGEPLIRKWAPILSYCPDRSISNILYGFTLHCPEDSPSSTFATFPPTFTKRYGWQAHYVSTRRAACCLWSTMPKECRAKGTTSSP